MIENGKILKTGQIVGHIQVIPALMPKD